MVDSKSKQLEEITNLLKIIAWKSLSEYRYTKNDIIKQFLDSKIKKQIWNLCDGGNCQADIAKELDRDRTTIRDHFKPMFDEGIVFTKSINNKNILISLDILIQKKFESIDWF